MNQGFRAPRYMILGKGLYIVYAVPPGMSRLEKYNALSTINPCIPPIQLGKIKFL